jgi:hypothetical protein
MSRNDNLDSLIAAFARHLQEEHPNPGRIGCPGRAALTQLATKTDTLEPASVLEHIRQCAACLAELRDLRMPKKSSQH